MVEVIILERPVLSANMKLVVEPAVDLEIGATRHRWRLVSNTEPELMSPNTYGTRREALREGETMLERARRRGSLRPPTPARFNRSAGSDAR